MVTKVTTGDYRVWDEGTLQLRKPGSVVYGTRKVRRAAKAPENPRELSGTQTLLFAAMAVNAGNVGRMVMRSFGQLLGRSKGHPGG